MVERGNLLEKLEAENESLKQRLAQLEAVEVKLAGQRITRADLERIHRLMFDYGPFCYQSLDKSGCFLNVNQTWLEKVGYSREEVIGKRFDYFLAPDSAKNFLRNFPKLKSSGKVRGVEFELVRKDGNSLNMSLMGISGYDDAGSFQQTHCILQDVTEEKESLKKFNSFFYQNPCPMTVTILPERIFVDVNEAFLNSVGYTRNEVIGKTSAELGLFVDEDAVKRMVGQLRTNGSVKKMEMSVRSKKGDVLYGLFSGETIKIKGKTYLLSAMLGITKIKRLQEELRRSEEKFRKLTETAPDWIWEMDLDGKVLYSNPAVEQVTGYKAEDLINKMAPEFIHSDSIGDLKTLISKCIRTRSGWHGHIGYWIHKDGTIRVLEAGGVPLLDENNRVTGFRGIARDITERKQLELEKLDVQQKLLHAQKLESLVVMAGGIAHDFNNLLMGIMGNLELVISDPNIDPVIRQRLESALTASERSAELSTKMLIYSGSGAHIPADIDLKKLLSEMKPDLEQSLTGSATLHMNIDNDLPSVRGEAGHIKRLITNLVTNAWEALGDLPGHITVTASYMDCDESYLSQSSFKATPIPGKYVYIQVSDDGCGMEDEAVEKIFDPFFTTKFWGRGLGMSEVLGMVKGHGGTIHVESSVGRGTTVRVLLPAAAEHVRPIPAKKGVEAHEDLRAQSSSDKKTILVIDDEDLVRDMVMARLDILGYESLAAVDGEQGVEIYKRRINEIDMVLMDFMMPRMNGVEAFEQLLKIDPNVKVILSSGYTEETLGKMFVDRKPDGILHKPYGLDTLKQHLDRILSPDN